MYLLFVISAGAFLGMFILFLVLSKTLNNLVNHLTKLEFILTQEVRYRHEAIEIRQLFSDREKETRDEMQKLI
jgi:hypothetical protein